jgi:hypothetical protein
MENELEIARLSREIYALSRRVAALESAEQNQSAVIASGDIDALERAVDLCRSGYIAE